MTIQAFKETDTTEAAIQNFLMPVLDILGVDRDTFYSECFESYLFGDVLFDLSRDPLVDVITQEVYRASFPAIHELFTRPGTFEFYISVFRKVFPEDVDIQFEIPDPGKLEITLNALTLAQFYLLTRRIVADVYVYENLVTSGANEKILVRGTSGIKTQSEIEGLVAEISAYGIYTTVTLVTP